MGKKYEFTGETTVKCRPFAVGDTVKLKDSLNVWTVMDVSKSSDNQNFISVKANDFSLPWTLQLHEVSLELLKAAPALPPVMFSREHSHAVFDRNESKWIAQFDRLEDALAYRERLVQRTPAGLRAPRYEVHTITNPSVAGDVTALNPEASHEES